VAEEGAAQGSAQAAEVQVECQEVAARAPAVLVRAEADRVRGGQAAASGKGVLEVLAPEAGQEPVALRLEHQEVAPAAVGARSEGVE
jgi:hypothetical protein